MRIEKGTYGVCRDCGEPIAEARLNAILDARLHHLQGKAEGVSTHRPRSQLIREFYLRARRRCCMRHEDVGARSVTDYDINNTYQYIITREETHLSWLQHALLDLGAPLPGRPGRAGRWPPARRDAWKALAAEDAARQRRSSSRSGARRSRP